MAVTSLLERLRELNNPRDPKGQLDPFVPRLTLGLVATLAGCDTVAAMARFGRLRGAKLGHALGFKSGRMPCANAVTNLRCDGHARRLLRKMLGNYGDPNRERAG